MTFQQCRYLVEVSKHHSISKAAAALYVTQPTISKAIQDLEEELGITILDRTNKGVLFTKDGTELLFYAKMLLEQMASVVFHFNKEAQAEITKLSVSSQHYSFAVEAFAGFMQYFAERKYELTLREGNASDVIEEVYAGRSIVGILSLTDQNRNVFERYFTTKRLVFTPLASMRQHVFLRQEHPLAQHKVIRLEQLEAYPYLTYQKDDVMLHFAEDVMDIHTLGKVVYLKDRGTMNDLLSNSDGYNLGTGCIVRHYMNPNIIAIPLDVGELIQVGYVRREDVFVTEEMSVFIDLVSASIERSKPA